MFSNSHALPVQDLKVVKEQLRHAIIQAEKFSRKPEVNANNWADWFSDAIALLDSINPKIPFHPDMLPDKGFSLGVRQIIASATQAYVFGGVGSWNDLVFEKPEIQEEYEKVTSKLYETVKYALVMASNSFTLDD